MACTLVSGPIFSAPISAANVGGVPWLNTTYPNGTNGNNDGGACVGQGGGL